MARWKATGPCKLKAGAAFLPTDWETKGWFSPNRQRYLDRAQRDHRHLRAGTSAAPAPQAWCLNLRRSPPGANMVRKTDGNCRQVSPDALSLNQLTLSHRHILLLGRQLREFHPIHVPGQL